MKFKYIIPVLAAVAAVSCQKADQESDSNLDPNAVRIEATVGGVFTRSNPLEEGAASSVFNAGDVVMVAAEAQGAVGYTCKGTTWSAETGKYLRWETPTMTFKAWYPQTASMTDFTLPTDQSTTARIESADYMTYSGDHTRDGATPISLTLQRKTARIILKIAAFGNEYAENERTVSDVKIHSGAAGYSADAVNGSVTELTPYTTDNGEVNSIYTALVIPTAEQATKTFISVVDDGSSMLLTKGIPAMEAGKSYTYNVKVGKDEVAITGITVNDWATGEAIPDGESEIVEPWDGTVASGFTHGLGTEIDPFQIHSAAELAFMSTVTMTGDEYNHKRYFKLCTDINLGYRDWTPIGSGYNKDSPSASQQRFIGYFDGGGHTITGLKVTNIHNYKSIGLFGEVTQESVPQGDGAYTAIKNLNIVDARVDVILEYTANEEYMSAGILAGGIHAPHDTKGNTKPISIENCHVSGTVTATERSKNSRFMGGIIGTGYITYFENCSTHVTINDGCISGAFAGSLNGCKVTNCSSKGTISGRFSLGGFVGTAKNIELRNEAGGEVIFVIDNIIKNCKSSVDITASDWNIGGFVGFSKATIENCTASGNVTSTLKVNNHIYRTGGFAGTNAGVISYSTFSGILTGGDTTADAWEYYGGFIGNSFNGRTEGCRFDGTKNPTYDKSGLSGVNEGSTTGNDISDSL